MNSSSVHAYHAKNTVKLQLKESTPGSQIPFAGLVTSTPELRDKHRFSLHPLLFNSVLQNMYIGQADFSKVHTVYYGRRIIESTYLPGQFTLDYHVDPEDPEVFAQRSAATQPENYPKLHPRTRYYTEQEIDRVHKKWQENTLPIVLVLHGLSGGSHEQNIRSIVDHLEGTANVAVLNSRGCARSKITTPTLFSGLHTDDLRQTVQDLRTRFPDRQLHLVGVSLGGLILSNYLAEESEKSLVTSAFTVGAPWNLQSDMEALTRSVAGKYMFEPYIRQILLRVLKSNIKGLKANPDFDEQEFLDLYKNATHVSQIDDRYTCREAGLPSASTYYMAASPLIRIFKIKTPMVILNSLDDPFLSCNYPVAEVQRNPYLYMASTDKGAHYAYVDPKGDMWYSPVIKRYIESWKDIKDVRPDDGGFNVKQTKFKDAIDLY
ncbi:hypothetical protein KL928_002494 [Ogataea angusta]|uniref:AB hydrolase-1 domain-containing protein n=1 Tax=Pichia angusta TaxID=870730 RepID=A0AAN6I6P8_PICAN|nr:uncharacterized protein KL928_002494 [Ogataea angusta]KAG7819820.1 hypothetical protein KL928_002494 [Ogataea angusta]